MRKRDEQTRCGRAATAANVGLKSLVKRLVQNIWNYCTVGGSRALFFSCVGSAYLVISDGQCSSGSLAVVHGVVFVKRVKIY